MTDTTELQPQLIAVRELATIRSDVHCEERYGYFVIGKPDELSCVQGYWDVEGSPFVVGNGIRLIARGRNGKQVARFEFFDDAVTGERLAAFVKVMLEATK